MAISKIHPDIFVKAILGQSKIELTGKKTHPVDIL
jgi:hypothetical protein